MLFVSGQADCPDVKLEGGHFKWNLEGEVKLEREGGKGCCCRKKTAPEEPKEKEGEYVKKSGFPISLWNFDQHHF